MLCPSSPGRCESHSRSQGIPNGSGLQTQASGTLPTWVPLTTFITFRAPAARYPLIRTDLFQDVQMWWPQRSWSSLDSGLMGWRGFLTVHGALFLQCRPKASVQQRAAVPAWVPRRLTLRNTMTATVTWKAIPGSTVEVVERRERAGREANSR